ncbi:MAG: Gfo/Idh/MocA family oxidoreductase [Bryobacterales bacterium]|nr:Gfo/Idh/MocA family oxidoreductase [Bryobacterales bacterium]
MPELTRRSVLAVLLQPPARTVGVAFLGVAHSHARAKFDMVRADPRFRLLGVAEDNPQLRSVYGPLGVPLLGRAELLARADVELVVIESEVPRHEKDGLDALNAGKHVHLEKPPSDNRDGMQALVAAARRGGRLMQLGYMWRHHPGIQRLLEVARSGALGDVYLVRGTMNTLIDAVGRKQWNLFPGGQMFEQGCHLLDPIVRLMGKPLRIQSTLRTHGQFNDTLKDNTLAVLEYPRAMAVVTSSVLQPNANAYRALEIFGTKGTAVLRPIEPPVLEINRAKVELAPFRRYEGDFSELYRCITAGQALNVTPEEDLLVQDILLEASGM